MAESTNTGWGEGTEATLVRASQVAREAELQRSANGVRFATYGETGVPGPDLDRMLEAVPGTIARALSTNTYFFVPLALREPDAAEPGLEPAVAPPARRKGAEAEAMVAPAWSEDLGEAAICHRNVELDKELGRGQRGVFISTRLMGDRFALSFEFFINVAHAFLDAAGVPERFAALAWEQALQSVRGETSLDAWEARHLALGKPLGAEPATAASPAAASRRARSFGATSFGAGSFGGSSAAASTLRNRSFGAVLAGGATGVALQAGAQAGPQTGSPAGNAPTVDEKERQVFVESAFSDALAIYLLSLVLDLDYSELRERDYPLLAPGALAERLRLVAELYPANPGYEFAVRYRRRA